jgi:hypothetical protein
MAASINHLAMVSRTVTDVPNWSSDLQVRSKASPMAEVAAASNETSWFKSSNEGYFIAKLPEMYERERKNGSQSPRLEAVSVMEQATPPNN